MLTESDRLSRLVQQIIELSRLQGDEPLEAPHVVDVDDVIKSRRRQHGDGRRATGTSRSSPGGRRACRIFGNEEQVSAAVTNLVANAVAYSGERLDGAGDRRRRSTTWSRSRWSTRGSASPPHELDRIFERFYRIDPARHRSTGGTGLGLSIVKHVAATHGGDVRVWSLEGQGSTFTLSLPRSRPEEHEEYA